ncbi:hypothetical protein [Mycolicibacterium phlei]
MRIAAFVLASVLSCSILTTSIATTGQAAAGPADMCSFSVTPPQVHHGPGGTAMAVTTLTVDSCPGTWQPTKSSVCIAPAGAGGSCTHVYGWGPGRAAVPLTAADGRYEATGRGCARLDLIVEDCVPVTPAHATLPVG